MPVQIGSFVCLHVSTTVAFILKQERERPQRQLAGTNREKEQLAQLNDFTSGLYFPPLLALIFMCFFLPMQKEGRGAEELHFSFFLLLSNSFRKATGQDNVGAGGKENPKGV